MTPLTWTIAVVVLGIDVGWQPLSEGGSEFVLQIEPDLLSSLEQGQEIVSALPPEVRDIRSLRVRVGNGRLPRELATPPVPVVKHPEGSTPETPIGVTAENSALTSDRPTPTSLHIDRQPGAQATFAEPTADDDIPSVEVDETPTKSAEPQVQLDEATPSDEDAQLTESAPPMTDAPKTGKVNQVVGYGSQADAITSGSAATTGSESALVELNRTVNQVSQSRPWLIAAATAILFLSIGANLFLAWVTWDARWRYLALLRRVKGNSLAPLSAAGA